MRFRRLDLTRFGAFTDLSLDFGAADSAPDLHIIYGPNEAGKSTLRAAINDLLFGIPPQSDYAFLHAYKAMEVGGTLETGGQSVVWRRLKRRKDDLVTRDGRAANRTLLDAALGGMDRETFELMFSLDSETLKEGGEELYRSRGRLGEALFAATSGLSSISAKLEEVRGEAEDFFKPRGKKQRLNDLKRELEEVDTALKEVAVTAPQYRKLVEAYEEARAAHGEAKRDAELVRKRLKQIERWQGAMRDWAKLRMARERLAPLYDTPEIPDEAAARIHDLDEQAGRLRREIEQGETELQRLKEERDALAPDEAVLAEAERIDRLNRMEDRYKEARDSLPAAEADLAAERGRIGATLEKLGVDPASDPRALLLPAPLTSQLDEMIRAHDSISTTLATAKEEAEKAGDTLAALEESLKALGDPVDPALLHQLRVAGRDARVAHDTTDLEEAVASAAAKRDEAFAALTPWSGSADALRAMTPPATDQLTAWAEERAAQKDKRAQAERRRAEQAARAAEFRETIAALEQATGLVSDEELERKRTARDAAWRTHREAISDGDLEQIAKTADAFEAVMMADDAARARRERHGDEAARLRQLTIDVAQAEAAAKHAAQERDSAEEALDALQERIDEAAAALGLPSGWEPGRIQQWLEARTHALAAQDEWASLQTKLDAQRDNRAVVQERLSQALAAAGAAPGNGMPLDALLEFAESVAQKADAREVKREQKQEEYARAKAQCEARQRRLTEAEQAQAEWTAHWQELLGQCWLAQEGTARQPGEVRDILRLLDSLRDAVERAEALERNIQQWRATEADFLALCHEVCAATETPLNEDHPGNALTALRERLAAGRDQRAKREQTEQELAREHDNLTRAKEDLDTVAAELGALCERFGAADAEALRAAIGQAKEKAAIKRDIAEREENLRAAFDGRPIAEIEQELLGCDTDELAAEAQALSDDITARDERLQELYHAMKKAEEQVAAVGTDEKAAELSERRRGLLLQIEEETQRYLRLMAGVAAAEAALRLYRDKHRSDMMLNAAQRFRRITDGRFTDLQARPDKDGETLVAIKADGGSLLVEGMSDGTRDQLYLALRMAGYQEFAATREPLPFIADDIMQSFDDERARASFEMLADVAQMGQVIYLTHHAHLCDLAREAVAGAVRIHELPAPAAQLVMSESA
ncbi:YhaN family protein [Dichotomicrobium thermohalophilum]|uniref:Uncharacterized protein YhaN n=1 Tax=Dichotomicrobium thermohalophilum TaxID=933063 RepID=A0A397Q2R7_9HYPH|nr:YhaN family protein [Dichotomicrobium thermohalophilum]RIA55432.1 uncharacterized protein YhaN [Dichotomicrobium thermohalophilum]